MIVMVGAAVGWEGQGQGQGSRLYQMYFSAVIG